MADGDAEDCDRHRNQHRDEQDAADNRKQFTPTTDLRVPPIVSRVPDEQKQDSDTKLNEVTPHDVEAYGETQTCRQASFRNTGACDGVLPLERWRSVTANSFFGRLACSISRPSSPRAATQRFRGSSPLSPFHMTGRTPRRGFKPLRVAGTSLMNVLRHYRSD